MSIGATQRAAREGEGTLGEVGQTHLFEHPVCLVEHEHLDAVHGEARRVAHVVNQSTGSRDNNVGALLQLGFLDFQGQTACRKRLKGDAVSLSSTGSTS